MLQIHEEIAFGFTIDNNVATMHVTAKLINRSSDNINMNRAANNIAEGIATSFSGSFTVDGKSILYKLIYN